MFKRWKKSYCLRILVLLFLATTAHARSDITQPADVALEGADVFINETGDTTGAMTEDLNLDNNTFVISYDDNKVGILTATPSAPLDVIGNISGASQAAPAAIKITATTQNAGALMFQGDEGGGTPAYGRITYDAGNYRFNFWAEDGLGDQSATASFGIPIGGQILWGGVNGAGYLMRDATGVEINGRDRITLSTKSDNTKYIDIPYGDMKFSRDGVKVYFGADDDVFLTHVADTGLLLNSSRQLQFGDNGTNINQATDGHLDLTADVSIDLNGVVEITGDTYWTGDGTGIPYGHMYTNTTIAVTIASSSTPTEVFNATSDGFTAGKLNLVTFPTGGDEHYISVDKAGFYKIDYAMSYSQNTPSAAIDVETGIMIGGSAQNEGVTERNLANNSDIGSVSSTAILDLAADVQISLYLNNKTNTTNIDVEHANISVIMIGGT